MSLEWKLENHIATVILSRPESYNAINRDLLTRLFETLNTIALRKDTRVVIITGKGNKAFSSGADLKERRDMTESEVKQFLYLINETFNFIERMPQPVIAAINGVAYGGGMELALACDLRIISEDAVMGLTETSLGIIPGAGGTQRLSRLIGSTFAKELIFTARKIRANEAYQRGLVNVIVPYENLLSKAYELANEIVVNAPIAVAQAKFAINFGKEVDLATGLAIERKAYEITLPTKDRLEGLVAFRDKRKPNYIGE